MKISMFFDIFNKKKSMKKIIVVIVSILLVSCSTANKNRSSHVNFKDELNSSIIDGFFNNDTTNICTKNIYLIR